MRESPTRQLADEHEFVKLVVGAMDDEVAYIERTGRVHAERVAQMIDFTRNFTDGIHHAKEEDLLFPLLEARSAAAGGTVSVLLSEHEAARGCIRAIDAALPDAEGSEEARGVIAENLKLYAFLLPLHIGKEDTVLFPPASVTTPWHMRWQRRRPTTEVAAATLRPSPSASACSTMSSSSTWPAPSKSPPPRPPGTLRSS
jgi:hemerythrin-like domain-containing protein